MSNDRPEIATPTPRPQGRYVPAVHVDGTVQTAGMTPRIDGVLTVTGRVGAGVTIEDARNGAALAAINALGAVKSVLPNGFSFRCTEMIVYICATDSFTEHSAVADGASSVIAAHLGDHGLPARSAVGVYSLPGGSPVEVALTGRAVPKP